MSYILEALKRAEAQAELERKLQLDAVDAMPAPAAVASAVASADSAPVNAATPNSRADKKWPTAPIAIAIAACAIVAASYAVFTDWGTPSIHDASDRITAAAEPVKQPTSTGDSRTEPDHLPVPVPVESIGVATDTGTGPETMPTSSALVAQPLSATENATALAQSAAAALHDTSQGNATHASKLREQTAAADIAQQRAARELALKRVALAEQHAREQALRAKAAEQQVVREQTSRKIALAEQSAREQALRADAAEQQVAREQALSKIALAEQSAREQALRADAAEQRVAREQTLRKIALTEQGTREQALQTDAAEPAAQQQVGRNQATDKLLALQRPLAETESNQFTLVGRVVGIKGPCSFEVRNNDTIFQITLSHIVCPKPGESVARAARSFATRRVFTREIGLAHAQRTGPRSYNGRIIESDGSDLSAELVRSGLAWPLSGHYAGEERQARAAKLGIWVN